MSYCIVQLLNEFSLHREGRISGYMATCLLPMITEESGIIVFSGAHQAKTNKSDTYYVSNCIELKKTRRPDDIAPLLLGRGNPSDIWSRV